MGLFLNFKKFLKKDLTKRKNPSTIYRYRKELVYKKLTALNILKKDFLRKNKKIFDKLKQTVYNIYDITSEK